MTTKRTSKKKTATAKTGNELQHNSPEPAGKRLTYSVKLFTETIERARNAVYWTPGLSVSGLVEESVNKAIDQLERKRGEAFPARPKQIKSGRPIR